MICQLTEVMDDEVCWHQLEVYLPDLMLNQFVNTTDEIDIRVSPEETAVFVRYVRRGVLRSLVTEVVGHTDAVPAAIESARHVVTNRGYVSAHLGRAK